MSMALAAKWDSPYRNYGSRGAFTSERARIFGGGISAKKKRNLTRRGRGIRYPLLNSPYTYAYGGKMRRNRTHKARGGLSLADAKNYAKKALLFGGPPVAGLIAGLLGKKLLGYNKHGSLAADAAREYLRHGPQGINEFLLLPRGNGGVLPQYIRNFAVRGGAGIYGISPHYGYGRSVKKSTRRFRV